MKVTITTAIQRAVNSVQILPTGRGWGYTLGITSTTTLAAGIVAYATNFIDPIQDYDPPKSILQPLSAFIVPSLVEEIFWRGAFIPINTATTNRTAVIVLTIHVLSHPILAKTIWPRGSTIFGDARFLLLATIVLGGATASFIVTGGSVWAAAITHCVPVILWRDFFGGERKLLLALSTSSSSQ